jgi:(R,R)-butanediol dehydrogenase/meso-butanediol dehydrogenase/diacetyl reductase
MSGTVIEAGSKVKDFANGDQVCVNPSLDDRHFGLETCSACSQGKINLCKRWATYGLNAPGGGFSSEIVVKAINCMTLPEGVDLKLGALAEPLAVAWHSIRTSEFKPGQNALILGAGPIGLAILILLRSWGANKIAITEVTEQRSLQARAFGADAVINPLQKTANGDENPVLAGIRELMGDGVDVAYDATGLQSTLDTAIAAVKPGGTIFNVAIHEKPLSLNLNDIACMEKKLLGGICYTREDFEGVLKVMAKESSLLQQMITAVVPLENIVDGGFQELIRNKAKHVKILIQPTAA